MSHWFFCNFWKYTLHWRPSIHDHSRLASAKISCVLLTMCEGTEGQWGESLWRTCNIYWVVAARMLQASWGRDSKKQRQQTSPNHVEAIKGSPVYLKMMGYHQWGILVPFNLTCTRQKMKGRVRVWQLCSLLLHIRLIYLKWKPCVSPFIWGMVAWSTPRGYRVTHQNKEGGWQRSARPHCAKQ